MTLLLLLAGLALAADPPTAPTEPPRTSPIDAPDVTDHLGPRGEVADLYDLDLELPPALYPGELDRFPVPHWRVRLPGGRVASGSHTERTRPVLVGEHVYVGAAAGSALYALSRRDGSLVREYPASESVESEPVVSEDRLYFADTGGTTWAYALDGTLLWKHEGASPILSRPTLADGRLYVSSVNDLVVALDATDGDLLWRYQRPPDLTRTSDLTLYAATPAVPVGELVLLGFSDGFLVALDAELGEAAWERRVGEGRYPDVVAAPVAAGDDVYASGYFAPFVAIDRETQNVRWRVDAGGANPVVLDTSGEAAVLFHPGTDGVLRAVDAVTGAVKWQWRSETTGALTTPVVTEVGLLVASSDGQVYLIDPATGRERWRYHEPTRLTGVTSAPSVEGRQVVFVTNASYLHSMLAPEREPIEHPPPYPLHRRD